MIEVNEPDEIPDGMSEKEMAEFWRTHSLGPGMLARMTRVDERPTDESRIYVALRFYCGHVAWNHEDPERAEFARLRDDYWKRVIGD